VENCCNYPSGSFEDLVQHGVTRKRRPVTVNEKLTVAVSLVQCSFNVYCNLGLGTVCFIFCNESWIMFVVNSVKTFCELQLIMCNELHVSWRGGLSGVVSYLTKSLGG